MSDDEKVEVWERWMRRDDGTMEYAVSLNHGGTWDVRATLPDAMPPGEVSHERRLLVPCRVLVAEKETQAPRTPTSKTED